MAVTYKQLYKLLGPFLPQEQADIAEQLIDSYLTDLRSIQAAWGAQDGAPFYMRDERDPPAVRAVITGTTPLNDDAIVLLRAKYVSAGYSVEIEKHPGFWTISLKFS